MACLLPQRNSRARVDEVGTELLRLHHGPLGEVSAGDADRETEVVLDPGAGPRLAPDRDLV